jgi:hypothetical protein
VNRECVEVLHEMLSETVLTSIDACGQPLQGHGNGLSISAAAPEVGHLYAVHCGTHDSTQSDAQMLTVVARKAMWRNLHCKTLHWCTASTGLACSLQEVKGPDDGLQTLLPGRQDRSCASTSASLEEGIVLKLRCVGSPCHGSGP